MTNHSNDIYSGCVELTGVQSSESNLFLTLKSVTTWFKNSQFTEVICL